MCDIFVDFFSNNLLVGVSTQMRFTLFCCFGASKAQVVKSRHSSNIRVTAPRAPAIVQNPVSLKSRGNDSLLLYQLSVLSLHLTAKHRKVVEIIILIF